VDRENIRFVPIKTDDQLDLQALHCVRDRLSDTYGSRGTVCYCLGLVGEICVSATRTTSCGWRYAA
jgi:hypothetical protein